MAKLVIVYGVGDDCTWSAEITAPLEYESAEAFLVDFSTWAEKACADAKINQTYPRGEFAVGVHTFDIADFSYKKTKESWDKSKGDDWVVYLPEIHELDEWFEKYKDIT